jgi:hypothetical protein
MRINEARERVLAFRIHNLGARRKFQFGLRNDGLDPFAARDDRHVRPDRTARAVNYRRA